MLDLSDLNLTLGEEKALLAYARELVAARRLAYTGKLTNVLDMVQGGISIRRFSKEWVDK